MMVLSVCGDMVNNHYDVQAVVRGTDRSTFLSAFEHSSVLESLSQSPVDTVVYQPLQQEYSCGVD